MAGNVTMTTPSGETYGLFEHLLKQAHLLIAGASGSGKSVLVNGLICTALYRFPFNARGGAQFILIDPKRVELDPYRNLPHAIGYASEPQDMINLLRLATRITEQRYRDDQITLLAYVILRDEVMDGGFIQLIHNGYGPFIFKNPFSKMMRIWGIDTLASLINKAHKLFSNYHKDIEKDCTDEEFMALFEKYPDFDDLDDDFVENEEQWTNLVAIYIDEHIEKFAVVKTMGDS